MSEIPIFEEMVEAAISCIEIKMKVEAELAVAPEALHIEMLIACLSG